MLELARRDTLLEEQVKLAEAAAFGLWLD